MTPRLLDISRLVSRIGRGALTGIDRVELAYFHEFLARPEPTWFLCRLPRSYAILTKDEGRNIYNKINGQEVWPSSRIADLVLPGIAPESRPAVAYIWRNTGIKCKERNLTTCLQSIFVDGMQYFNVGHANLRATVFRAVKAVKHSEIIVLIHDVIPLSYPQFSRSEVVERFRRDLGRVATGADLVIYNSNATRLEAETFFRQQGRVPEAVVAHLGAGIDFRNETQHFENASKNPNFVILGTIEPRKNHRLLLDVWQGFCRDCPPHAIPHLHIIGRRGWGNNNVFNILDSNSEVMNHITEHNGVSDAVAQNLLAQSWALLFPSFAEGFGLPLIEAAQSGVPIICGENAIYHELLGDYPLYLNVDNSYLWAKRILERAGRNRESGADRQVRAASVSIPNWRQHFDRIFRFTCDTARLTG